MYCLKHTLNNQNSNLSQFLSCSFSLFYVCPFCVNLFLSIFHHVMCINQSHGPQPSHTLCNNTQISLSWLYTDKAAGVIGRCATRTADQTDAASILDDFDSHTTSIVGEDQQFRTDDARPAATTGFLHQNPIDVTNVIFVYLQSCSCCYCH